MQAGQGVSLSGATIAADELSVHPITMRFAVPAAELDFLRFRTAGRVPLVIATFAAYAVAFAVIAAATPSIAIPLAAAVNVLALIAEIVFVACRRPVSIDAQGARATTHERISAVGFTVSTLVMAATASTTFQQRCGDSPTREVYRECMTQFDFSNILAVATVMIAPRLTLIVPMNVLTTVVYVLNVNLSYAYFDPIDYVSDGVVMVGYMVALNVAAWVKERRERAFFLDIVVLQRSNAALDQQRESMRVVLAAALPAALLDDDALSERGVSHHSMHATVAVTDIYGFSAWSTWHLEVDVVFILHEVMKAYDKVIEDHRGVERAMSYGDSYVLCCGLLEPHREHAYAVMQSAIEMRIAARAVSKMVESSQFNTRTSIFTGELRGTSIGTASRRYAVTGPAFDAAVERIGTCKRDGVVAAAYRAVPERDSAPAKVVALPDAAARVIAPPEEQPAAEEPQMFSPVWLTFHETVSDGPVDPPRLLIADGVVPAVVITALLLAVLAEHASTDPRRHHSSQPVGLGLLGAAFIAAWANVAALAASEARLPLAAAAALKVAPVGLAGCGLALLLCYYAQPRVAFVLTVGYLCRFDITVPWLLQLFFVMVTAVVPAMLYSVRRHDTPGNLLITFGFLPFVCVIHRYFTVRAACEHIVAKATAARSVTRARDQSDVLDNLLGGLVPPHVLPAVCFNLDGAVTQGPTQVQPWTGLSLLQAKLHCDGRVLQEVWDGIAKAIGSAAGGLLELVQASGDTFLVGGPFSVTLTAAVHVAAARQVLVFLRELALQLKPTACTFTAIATSGTAYGALLGAANMTYRIFGAAVRENDAILAAAPRVIGAPRNVAFASDSFRRQERNFTVPNPLNVQNAAMSAALGLSQAMSGTEHDAACKSNQDRAFGTEQMWRAAGLGTASVSIVKI
jgi:class 3 adenylate cyclase